MPRAGGGRAEHLREEVRRLDSHVTNLEAALAAAKKGRTDTLTELDGAESNLKQQIDGIADAHKEEPLVTSATRRIIDGDPGVKSAFKKARNAIEEGFKQIISMINKALNGLAKERDAKKRELSMAEGPDAGPESGQAGSGQGGSSHGGGGSAGGGGGSGGGSSGSG